MSYAPVPTWSPHNATAFIALQTTGCIVIYIQMTRLSMSTSRDNTDLLMILELIYITHRIWGSICDWNDIRPGLVYIWYNDIKLLCFYVGGVTDSAWNCRTKQGKNVKYWIWQEMSQYWMFPNITECQSKPSINIEEHWHKYNKKTTPVFMYVFTYTTMTTSSTFIASLTRICGNITLESNFKFHKVSITRTLEQPQSVHITEDKHCSSATESLRMPSHQKHMKTQGFWEFRCFMLTVWSGSLCGGSIERSLSLTPTWHGEARDTELSQPSSPDTTHVQHQHIHIWAEGCQWIRYATNS